MPRARAGSILEFSLGAFPFSIRRILRGKRRRESVRHRGGGGGVPTKSNTKHKQPCMSILRLFCFMFFFSLLRFFFLCFSSCFTQITPSPSPPPPYLNKNPVVLGCDRLVHPRGAGALPQVRHVVLAAAAARLRAAEPAYLRAEGAEWEKRAASLQLHVYEPSQGAS